MKVQSLDELYVKKLTDLYDAENQIVGALPKMARAASSPELRDALERHVEQTKGQIKRLDQVFDMLGASSGNKQCMGMRGLLEEGKELLSKRLHGTPLDAALIAAARSVEHYEIAYYGSLQSWARDLGQSAAADLLEETLEEEMQADDELNDIAETIISSNGEVEEEEEEEEEEEYEDEDEEEEEEEEDEEK